MRPGRAAVRLSAVFLDRDGVINRKAPEGEYVTSWEQFAFEPGALEALRLLADGCAPVIVVTNQRGIARGRMTEADLSDIHARMRGRVVAAGGRVDAIYHCPHGGGCRCRKPRTGMFEDAAAEFELDLSMTAMIGDSDSDMDAARRIGAIAVRVGGRDGTRADEDHRAGSLLDAVRWVIGDRALSPRRFGARDAPDRVVDTPPELEGDRPC